MLDAAAAVPPDGQPVTCLPGGPEPPSPFFSQQPASILDKLPRKNDRELHTQSVFKGLGKAEIHADRRAARLWVWVPVPVSPDTVGLVPACPLCLLTNEEREFFIQRNCPRSWRQTLEDHADASGFRTPRNNDERKALRKLQQELNRAGTDTRQKQHRREQNRGPRAGE
eukprot:m.23538 g.23538  ORF g.23538 m.23538 type:complete len:169 (-) comp7217_c0_seq2:118-624(-)